jgi:predicted amidohydrolase
MPSTPWSPRPVSIALAQFAMSTEPKENLERALQGIEQAAKQGADIVCLPELFRSPYFCVNEKCERDYAEPIEGPVLKALSAAAEKLNIAVVGGSIYERATSGKLYNTSIVIKRNGELSGTYRKVHIPHDPAFYEQHYFEPGDLGFKVFDLGFAKVGVLICYDQWFPEAARSLALAGAEIIFYPTAIARVRHLSPIEGNWQEAWETVQRGHAIANNVVVCAVNRVGTEGDSDFWGGSFIANGFGQVLARGAETQGIVRADVDLGHSNYAREGWRFFHNRRPEQYASLVERVTK